MEQSTIVAIVGLVASLLGTTAGGLISHIAAKSARRDEWKNKLREKYFEHGITIPANRQPVARRR